MECGSYIGIKLLEHAMEVMERIFKHRYRQHIDIGWRGGATVGRRALGRKAVSSIPGQGVAA